MNCYSVQRRQGQKEPWNTVITFHQQGFRSVLTRVNGCFINRENVRIKVAQCSGACAHAHQNRTDK